ncbi:MAG: zinc ABC transporter substrate-binding protein [Syntrophales bacterium]|jgi:zinc transport system substrate-binding protein
MKTKSLVELGIVIVCAIVVWTAYVFYHPTNTSADKGKQKIKVITTLFPLYDMAKNIGGDKAEVSLLLPPGVEAHSFEPKPSDLVKMNNADVFIYTGKFMEPWAEQIIKSVTNKNLVVVDSSQGIKMISGVFHDADEPVGSYDPHIWLDFDNAKIMVKNISQAMEAKATQKGFFEQKASEYSSKLTELDSAYKTTLATCKIREIFYGGHYAFGYLANRYGLKYIAAQGFAPDAEPTARDLVKLIDQIKRDKIKYIFYEELTSPKIAETISRETNTKMLLLNAAHNLTKDQFERGVSFFDILKNDLDNLKVGLECQ